MMATWNALRIPDFVQNKCFSKQPVLAVDSPLSRPPPLEPMRLVKRNLFPAEFLRLKMPDMLAARRASSRLCGVEILEITRRANRFVSSRISVLHSIGTLRRTRSERKQDWDMVKTLLQDEHTTAPYDKFDETQRIIQFPVLPGILQREGRSLQIAVNDLPMMLLISPPKKIAVLSIDSNMCFDLEFLKSLLKDTQSSSIDHPVESASFLQIFNTPGQEKLIDPYSWQKRIEPPVVKSPVMWCSTIGRLNLGLSDLIFLSMPDTSDPAQSLFRTTGFTNDEVRSSALSDIEKYKVSMLQAVQKVLGCFKTSSTVGSVSENSWLQYVADAYFLKPDDLQDLYHFSKDISRPILLRTILASDGDNREKKLALNLPVPAARSTSLRANALLQSLSEFRRSLFTSEKSLWSRASKEVLCRAKYKRRKLLSPQTATLVLASKMCSAKLTTASFVGNVCEILDTLVFSRLRALLPSDHKRNSRTTAVLDMLDYVPEQVAKSRQQFLSMSCQRVMRMQHKYDSPTRKWSRVHFEKILTRYENMKPHSGEPNQSRLLKPGRLEDNDTDSDESVLNDFVLSGEELEWQSDGADGLGILEEIDGDLRHHGALKPGIQALDADVQRKEHGDLPDLGTSSGKKLKLRLKVPDMLVCAPWVVQVAEQCTKTMPRACIFLPPPLSVLPIVAILTHTHLRDSVRDQRVAIVCETETDVTDYIREYLQASLGQSVSIDSIKRSNYMSECVVPLPCTTARVVVFDSFLFSFTVNFSLLIVFVSSEEVSDENVRSRNEVFLAADSQWVRIPSVFVAPLDAWVGLQTYSKAVRYLSARLRVRDVLWVTANDDVYDSIAIASPRVVYLAPSRQASHLVTLLDAQAAPYLEAYKSLKRTHTAQAAKKSSRLQNVNLRLVRQTMEEACNSDGSGRCQKLELLHTLRQARSFAIHDGFTIAVAYLQHSSKQAGGQVRRVMNNILGDLEDEITSTAHPVVKALTSCLKEASRRMLQDPPSLRSIHRRDGFRPLIVANSQEAVNGCLQCLEDAIVLAEATSSSIAVCSLQQLNMELKSSRTGQLPEKLEEFSHLFHIVDDRYDSPSDLLLPPTVLQLVHAGRIRLITIAVDETRELDDRWDREVSCYDELSRNVGKEEFGHIAYKEPYLQQLCVESFWSVAKSTFPEWEEPVKETAQPSAPSDANMSLIRQTGFIRRNAGTFHVSSHVVCSSTANALREMLSKHVNALPNECSVLWVFICIQPEERCTPVVTYLHSALAGSERLQQKVLVQTQFIF